MNIDFDFREFQRESMEKLAKIYAEALIEQEDESIDPVIYEKMQKILGCKEMEKCHPYLFSLDRQHINEDDSRKISELYECGKSRGFILEDEDDIGDEFFGDDECDDQLCGGPADSLTGQELGEQPAPKPETSPLFTVLYSATKNGETKTGEYYSYLADEKQAKEDCVAQLTNTGYSSIQIMAVEQNKSAVDLNVLDHNADETAEQNKEEAVPEEPVDGLFETDGDLFEDDSEEYEKQETGDIEEEPAELTVDEKNALKTEYDLLFKETLTEMNMEKSFIEMTLEEKIDFLKKITEKWTKNDPTEFMDEEDMKKLNEFVPEKDEDSVETDDVSEPEAETAEPEEEENSDEA